MELRDHLIQLVTYEKWANEQWLNFVDDSHNKPNGGPFTARADECIGHIISCYRHWFDLLDLTNVEGVEDHRHDLVNQAKRMQEFLATCDFAKPLRRTWEEYGTYEWTTLQIIYHTISHGSYHRGQIREIAEELGFNEWPDTDYEVFAGTKIS